jgi:hypothetical protein
MMSKTLLDLLTESSFSAYRSPRAVPCRQAYGRRVLMYGHLGLKHAMPNAYQGNDKCISNGISEKSRNGLTIYIFYT